MAAHSGGASARVAIGLVGAGKGGLALLDLLLTWPGVTVAVVVDRRTDAPALTKANALGIPTAAHHLQVLAYPVTLILEATGQPAVLDELLRASPPGIEVMGGASLRFFWDLLAERQQRQREAEVIAALAQTINGSLELNTILQQVTDAARELCAADLAQCVLRDPDSDAMVFRYWAGGDYTEYETWRVESGKGAGGRVLVSGLPFRTDDYAADPRITKDYIARVQQAHMVAECVVPIRVAGRIDGLLYVDNVTRRPFTDRDEAVLVQLADHAAIAIQNTRLFADTERRRRAAESLVELNQAISASLDTKTVLREIAQAAGKLMEVPAVTLWVADETTQTLERRAVSDEALMTDFTLQTLSFGEGLLGRVAQDRQILNIPDALADDRLPGPAWWRAHHLVSFLGIPLEFEGSLLGVLALNGRQPFRLGPDDHALLRSFTAQAVAAIRNARLYEERTRAYEELTRTQEQLVQAQKMEATGRLAGGIAHDFNNLLVVIIGRSELLLTRLPETDPSRRPVELIRRAGEQAAALTRQLLAFSRKQVLQPTVLDLPALVARAEGMLRRLIGEDIHVVTRRSPTPCAVKADAGQLEQVILNLAVNARDAMPQGGQITIQTMAVELDAAFVHANPGVRTGPHAVLVVSDTGVGMTPDVQQHIFEPFFTTKESTKGTGLGLATVFGIVKQHEGYITVESAPGQGATFRVYLPQVEEGAQAATPTPTGPVLDGTETLLLVEDDEAVRDLAREILTGYGYTVVEARHPGEALLIGERRPGVIDLLVTDVVMPEMGGREMAERLIALRPGLKVVYMTGYTDDVILQHGVRQAGVTLLQKPFTPVALARAVREVLDALSARDERPPASRPGGG